MDDADLGQVSASAADVYEDFFVPALFGEWGPRLCDAAEVAPGQSVLDVACGTGVAARAAADRTGDSGRVTGIDRNDGMLAVARRIAPGIDWQPGLAETLPFQDGRFDTVLSQFGLMFFEDRAQALREMWRVLKPGGRLAVAVWDTAASSPGYASMLALLRRLFGAPAAEALQAPFVLGDPEELAALFAKAGLDQAAIETQVGTARFASIEAWVHTDVKGWTLADMIDEAQYARLLAAAKRELAVYAGADGQVAFPAPAHIVSATKA